MLLESHVVQHRHHQRLTALNNPNHFESPIGAMEEVITATAESFMTFEIVPSFELIFSASSLLKHLWD